MSAGRRDNKLATDMPSDASRTSRPVDRKPQKARSDASHTHAPRLRALSCVSGVGVRVSLGASKSPANHGLSRLWKRSLSSARQPSYEHRGCSHACAGNELTTFARARGRRRVDGARRGRLASSFGGRSTQSGGRRFGSPGARSPQRLPARDVRQRSEPRAARLLLASCMNGRATARTPGGRRGPSVRIDRARTPASTLESERHRP
jgi:hypothetical protein